MAKPYNSHDRNLSVWQVWGCVTGGVREDLGYFLGGHCWDVSGVVWDPSGRLSIQASKLGVFAFGVASSHSKT